MASMLYEPHNIYTPMVCGSEKRIIEKWPISIVGTGI